MKFALATVGQTTEKQSPSFDPTKYVRKNWLIFAAYDLATSLVVGLSIVAMLFLFSALDDSEHGKHKPVPVHDALLYSVAILGVLVAILFLAQLITGPFVFTKDVVCKRCHTRLRVNRVAFFTGKYSRPPRCKCGGKIEPAFLWKPESSAAESKLNS